MIATPHKKQVRAVNFICHASDAKEVSVVGDFNRWDAKAHPMRHTADDSWLLMVSLKHGHHRYAFMVDGKLVLDPNAQGTTRNEKGEKVSLLPVS
jgi:1,4-alpha-glucan branching enzyme